MARLAIDFERDIRPVSDFRANAADALRVVQETGRPLVLTQHGRSAAVLLGVSAFQSLLDELEELRDVQRGLADLAAGRVSAHEDVREEALKLARS